MILHLNQFFSHRAWRATGIYFALCGFFFGTWASFIPYVMEKHGLDEAELGLLLLCIPVGTLIANPLSVLIISKWGAAKSTWICLVLMGLTFSMPVISSNLIFAALGLILGGATFAVGNIAMNTCAADLIDSSGISLMSACHGMWSLGAMLGALLSGPSVIVLEGLAISWINPHLVYEICFLLLTIALAVGIRGDLLEIHENWERNKHPGGAGLFIFKPNKALMVLITICLCTYLTEGTMADWSAVYLKNMTKAPEIIVGWGFSVYAFFMAAGRFVGDIYIERHGHMKVLMTGGQLVVAGLALVIISPNPWWVFPGFMLIGLGISVASPILYGEAAKVPDLPPGVGLATLNSFAMVAFLGGPVLIGFMAKIVDLRIAFMFVAATAVLWVVQTHFIIRRNKVT
jgi:MFS family permease